MSETSIISIASSISKSSSSSSASSLPDGVISFSASKDSIYDVSLNLPFSAGFTESYRGFTWSIDGSFEIPFVSSVKSGNKTLLGSLYLKKGNHALKITNQAGSIPAALANAAVTFTPAEVYFYPRLVLAETWMRTLYNPAYNGYVEAQGWEDMWTHCQYLPEKFLYAKLSGVSELTAQAKNSADLFIIGKMIQPSGAAHTVYRAKKMVYEESIESNMVQGVWDLWRGNAAAVEEMINCYHQFGDRKYLDKAILCADYVINSWPVINVDGTGPIYANLTDGLGLQTQSVGRLVMVFCQLYEITGDVRYKTAAIAQGKGILRSQADNGLFYSAITEQWQHGNAYANAMLALGWLYRMTGGQTYKTAIDKAFEGFETAWTDDYGSLRLSGSNRETGMSTYLAGRMAQGLFTCAVFTGDIEKYRTAEKTLYYAFGRNILQKDMQNKTLGSYYYQLNYSGDSNIETSCEVDLGTLQLFYLKTYWAD